MMTRIRIAALAASAATALAGAGSPAPAQQSRVNESFIVTTAWLASHLNDPSVVVVDVSIPEMGESDAYRKAHIPGARLLEGTLVTQRDGLSGELPAVDEIVSQLEKLGISDSTLVVVYAPTAPSASRVLFTLDYIGHRKFAFLDGGITKWQAEARPVTQDVPGFAGGHITPHPNPGIVATADWITPRLGRPGMSLIDTRSDGEYLGTAGRHGMPSEGHLPGARLLEWNDLFADGKNTLNSRDSLQRMYAARVQPGDTVVTYCWVGYRASMTYFIARYLGYPVKMYDGSYQDWLKRKLPVRSGPTPN